MSSFKKKHLRWNERAIMASTPDRRRRKNERYDDNDKRRSNIA